MQYQITLTDTYGGEANFAWVKRATFDAPSDCKDSLLIRRAKKALGLDGKHLASSHCDAIELRWSGENIVAFIEPIS